MKNDIVRINKPELSHFVGVIIEENGHPDLDILDTDRTGLDVVDSVARIIHVSHLVSHMRRTSRPDAGAQDGKVIYVRKLCRRRNFVTFDLRRASPAALRRRCAPRFFLAR